MKKFSTLKKIYIALLFLGGVSFSAITLFIGFHPSLESISGKGGLIAIGIIVALLFFALAILEIVAPNKKGEDGLPVNPIPKKSAEQIMEDAINDNKKR